MYPDPHPEAQTEPEVSPAPRSPSRRVRRILAVGVGVAMVPALYAVANATTGGGGSQVDSRPSATVAAHAGADDPATELEHEHGVVVEKPHGGAPTPVPEATTPTVPAVTTPTTPEVEHPVPEPGDDNGVDLPGHDVGDDDGNDGAAAPAPVAPTVPAGNQSFSSVGGSITVTVANGALSLASSTPAAGFGAEVHDNGPSRVEVRFTDGQTEWRIRVELAGGGLTSEVTQHG